MPAAYIAHYLIQTFRLLPNTTVINIAIVRLSRELLFLTYWESVFPLTDSNNFSTN